MESGGDAVLDKVNKIYSLFSSLTENVSNPVWQNNKEITKKKQSAIKTQPQNREEFYNRVSSFRPGLWNVQELTPLECARWGWRIQEKDVLQCVTCREVVCAILPDIRDFQAYDKYLNLLKERLLEGHRDACGWRVNPSPEELVQPPYISSIEDMRNLTNSARTLAALNSALPHLDIQTLTVSLGADKELIEGLFQNDTTDYEVQASSILLVLSGWTRGEGAYLRCKICRRSVGLWNFLTRADELERTRALSPAPTPSGKRKRQIEDAEDSGEDEEMHEDCGTGPSNGDSNMRSQRKCLKADNNEHVEEEDGTQGKNTVKEGDNEQAEEVTKVTQGEEDTMEVEEDTTGNGQKEGKNMEEGEKENNEGIENEKNSEKEQEEDSKNERKTVEEERSKNENEDNLEKKGESKEEKGEVEKMEEQGEPEKIEEQEKTEKMEEGEAKKMEEEKGEEGEDEEKDSKEETSHLDEDEGKEEEKDKGKEEKEQETGENEKEEKETIENKQEDLETTGNKQEEKETIENMQETKGPEENEKAKETGENMKEEKKTGENQKAEEVEENRKEEEETREKEEKETAENKEKVEETHDKEDKSKEGLSEDAEMERPKNEKCEDTTNGKKEEVVETKEKQDQNVEETGEQKSKEENRKAEIEQQGEDESAEGKDSPKNTQENENTKSQQENLNDKEEDSSNQQNGVETKNTTMEENHKEKCTDESNRLDESSEMEMVMDCASPQFSAPSSPLIIGTPRSAEIKKVEKKEYFNPLEEHRHWCTWVMKIIVEEEDEEMSQQKKGYQMVTEQARDILEFSRRKDLSSSEKYVRNVEGLRSIRTMLNGFASVDTWLSEGLNAS